MANLKTVKNWQETLNCKLDILEIVDDKTKGIKCVVCSKYEDRIKNMKGFSKTWTDGTESVKKDSLEKHIKGDPHRKAWLLMKSSMGASSYHEKIASSTPIGRGLRKMLEGDKEASLRTIF